GGRGAWAAARGTGAARARPFRLSAGRDGHRGPSRPVLHAALRLLGVPSGAPATRLNPPLPVARLTGFPMGSNVRDEMRMRLKVCYHDNCFDGLASAATFTRFFLQKVDPKAEVEYEGLAYRGKNPFREGLLSGDVNAILDFRYTRDPKLDWYFDHHVSAFQEPGDEEHFRADPSGQKFWNPEAKSCTKFMADVLRTRFGFEPGPMEQLIHWADIIDGAQFPDAKMAVELEEPALRLMTLIEAERETAFLHRIIRWMQEEPLAEIVARPEVAARIEPLLEAHRENVELIRQRAECENGVVYFDISDQLRDNANKFIPYHLFPDCR